MPSEVTISSILMSRYTRHIEGLHRFSHWRLPDFRFRWVLKVETDRDVPYLCFIKYGPVQESSSSCLLPHDRRPEAWGGRSRPRPRAVLAWPVLMSEYSTDRSVEFCIFPASDWAVSGESVSPSVC